jgi:hypothetical protein
MSEKENTWTIYLRGENPVLNLKLLLEFVGVDSFLTSFNNGYVISTTLSKDQFLSLPFVERVEEFKDGTYTVTVHE